MALSTVIWVWQSEGGCLGSAFPQWCQEWTLRAHVHTGKCIVVLKSVNPYETKWHIKRCDINIHPYSGTVLPTGLLSIKTTTKNPQKPVLSDSLCTNMQLLPVISISKLKYRNVWNLNKVIVSFFCTFSYKSKNTLSLLCNECLIYGAPFFLTK